jgi:hypothetical protein
MLVSNSTWSLSRFSRSRFDCSSASSEVDMTLPHSVGTAQARRSNQNELQKKISVPIAMATMRRGYRRYHSRVRGQVRSCLPTRNIGDMCFGPNKKPRRWGAGLLGGQRPAVFGLCHYACSPPSPLTAGFVISVEKATLWHDFGLTGPKPLRRAS